FADFEGFNLPAEHLAVDRSRSRRRYVGASSVPQASRNTVDVDKATYTNTIGAPDLAVVWTDPHFDPKTSAAYYLRVLEIPTPRWSTIAAVKSGIPLVEGLATTIQERGWSSPIWFSTPPRSSITAVDGTCRLRCRYGKQVMRNIAAMNNVEAGLVKRLYLQRRCGNRWSVRTGAVGNIKVETRAVL
ncbi:MAG: DUF3604 domain-containing protein, partial [Woeseia sp.]